MYQLDDLLLFIAVVENKSLLKTSVQFAITQPTVGRRMRLLSEELGYELFISEGNHLTVTNFGKMLYNIIKQKIEYFDELKSSINELIINNGQNAGHLRLLLPPALSEAFITPLLPEFIIKYPNISFEIKYGHEIVDFGADLYDIAITAYMPTKQNQKVSKLFDFKFGLYCTQEYISKYGKPNNVTELASHRYVSHSRFGQTMQSVEFIHNETESVEMFYFDHKIIVNDHRNTLALIKTGEFIGGYLDFLSKEEPSLIRLLPDYRINYSTTIYLLRNPYVNHSVIDLFINFLRTKIKSTIHSHENQ